uniref:Uncharacterized protein n=1 Tax=Chromera velia CCMP2878 TaxID=1169474 RepID=A0A0G4HGG6_9ALVE|eukprot:Cvel_6757.t1-p1 / transcript=Cvel_6757.t1 / gene=Cvel_6757 / organism=Chromera_velia_CCMP2878 / gene_product=hypothetical protein / transcript_product=hypothetical protein / location=Cvel_scaffold339:6356-6814(-) / protein_length=153 / sequence_SO=supercontig / SO=protein_coding / is_pseudo=false
MYRHIPSSSNFSSAFSSHSHVYLPPSDLLSDEKREEGGDGQVNEGEEDGGGVGGGDGVIPPVLVAPAAPAAAVGGLRGQCVLVSVSGRLRPVECGQPTPTGQVPVSSLSVGEGGLVLSRSLGFDDTRNTQRVAGNRISNVFDLQKVEREERVP